MKITITGKKINLRESFKERVEKKLAKFERIFGEDADAAVKASLEKDRYTVEVTVRSRGLVYRAEDTSSDLNESLDNTLDHLSRQIRKNKSKLDKKLKVDAGAEIFVPLEENEPEIDEEKEFEIVRAKKYPVKEMTVDEAILQMNMLGHEFFLFRNEFTKEINVVYRRSDGNYGHIEPEAE